MRASPYATPAIHAVVVAWPSSPVDGASQKGARYARPSSTIFTLTIVGCTLTPFTVARWHGIFWDTPKWEPNKRGRVVEWQVIACNTESRCPLFRPFAFHILLSPYFGYVFPRRYKTRQLPVNPEFRTVSFEFDLKKLYSLLFLAKTPLSTKRWVWDLIGVEFVLFFIVLGPGVLIN